MLPGGMGGRGLDAAEVARIVEALRAALAPERILVFGSYARGESGPDSDLDLIVVAPSAKRWLDRQVEARLALDTDLAVDVIVLTPEELRERIDSGDPSFRVVLAEARTLYDARAA